VYQTIQWADSVNGEHGCFASSKVGIVTPSVHQVFIHVLSGAVHTLANSRECQHRR